MNKNHIRPYQTDDYSGIIYTRPGETKAGQVMAENAWRESDQSVTDWLSRLHSSNVSHGILLVPEDIGPRGNLGRAGARKAPEAFLRQFANLQANRFLDFSRVIPVGEVDIEDLNREAENATVEELRNICHRLDDRVRSAVECIVNAGLKPIIIGGGNNNSLPTISGIVSARQLKGGISCINCDPHADYRMLEGRHSGNPFSYAHKRELLSSYLVFALHENYNSQEMMERLQLDGYDYISFESIIHKGHEGFDHALKEAIEKLQSSSGSGSKGQIGLELDLDSIKHLATSARTPVGISEEEALKYIHDLTTKFDTLYLHLSEGAPGCTTDDGMRSVGKFLAYAVATFLKADNGKNS